MDVMIRKYVRSVSRRLRCMPDTKRKLLAGLEQELREFPVQSTVSVAALTESYGTAADTAHELQLCVSEEEFEKWLKRRKAALWLMGIAVFVALALAFWYVNWGIEHMPVYCIETIH